MIAAAGGQHPCPLIAGMDQRIPGTAPERARQYERRPDWLSARLATRRPRGHAVAKPRLFPDGVRGARDSGGVH